jgi:Domain of unknown function (DUF4349)
MLRRDEFPLDPEIVSGLESIDATLTGEAVDPRHAELAELALLLAADRPVIEEGFARLLDQQVRERAFSSPSRARAAGARRKHPAVRRGRTRWWVWAPASAVAASLVAAVVIVAGESRGGSSNGGSAALAAPLMKAPASARRRETLGQGAATTPSTTTQMLAPIAPQHHSGAQSATSSAGASSPVPSPPSTGGAGVPAPLLQPPTGGRKVIQGAQLALTTAPQRVDQVSQEVYNVIGQQNGIVKASSVTANGGHGGYAQFQLSVPSSNLARTMAALSTLPFAHVSSRTDNTQDVTNDYRVNQQRLNDARALHTSLLKQLANATTQAQIESLKARIHDDEGAIAADESALRSLQRRVGYSQINLQINSGSIPVPLHHGGGFTLGKAAHDAGTVLTVAAGVALIVLAALVPVGLILALLWWVTRTARRRSRQQALDLA